MALPRTKRALFVAPILALVGIAAWAVSRVGVVTIDDSSADLVLTSTHDATTGVTTLIPGAVHGLHLTDDSSANGYRIADVAPGEESGDAMVYGQPLVSPDFIGAMPDLVYRYRPMVASVLFQPYTLAKGDCIDNTVVVWGARRGMAVAISPRTSDGADVFPVAWIPDADRVTARLCPVVDTSTVDLSYRVTVWP